MTNNLIQFPPLGADEHASAETERKQRLFAWADRVLREMGLAERIARASSLDELRKITFDPDAAEVALAIRDALHPRVEPKPVALLAYAKAESNVF